MLKGFQVMRMVENNCISRYKWLIQKAEFGDIFDVILKAAQPNISSTNKIHYHVVIVPFQLYQFSDVIKEISQFFHASLLFLCQAVIYVCH